MLDRRAFLVWVGAGAGSALLATPARAQQRRVAKIAYLSGDPPNDYRSQGFRDGMREFRYTEGTDYVVAEFFAPSTDEMPQAAAAAAASAPDLIVAMNTNAAIAAKDATKTIPIVAVALGDPIGAGVVASLGRPGGNATGPSLMIPDLAGKRLQLLTQMAPKTKRVGIMFDPGSAAARLSMNELIPASQKLHVLVSPVEVRTAEQLEAKIEGAAANGIDALYFIATPKFTGNVQTIAQAALRQRLPAIYDFAEFAEAGGLVSYGPNLGAVYRRAAYYVDRILKGAKPADLPVEQPMRFDFVINKKTAAALGLEIPLGLLVGATEVIE